ncbi:glycosyltransferase [Acrocarpospora catenulata]|uniref:glycosyltransferase n=1 Tax=Acrocarpospora catenulata TaxID=2836182 RepID=UPI001BDA0845|nr:glycosyltransferase [Acrocarpospora catenulata]
MFGNPSRRPELVVQLIGHLGQGGAEHQGVLLAKELAARGVRSEVLVMYGGGRDETLQKAGIPVHHLGFRTFSRYGLRALPAVLRGCLRMIVYLRRRRPDVLHTHLFQGHLTTALLARPAGARVLVAAAHAMTGRRGASRLVRLLDRRAARRADYLLAGGGELARRVAESTRLPDGRIGVAYAGLPADAFARYVPAQIDTRGPVILAIGALHPSRGHSVLLGAASLLRQRGLDCTVVILGEGPERATLSRLAASFRVDARLLGARPDVGRWLARADVLAHPSLSEHAGLAVMEAMAAGVPVAASAIGGVPELLTGRGLLVPPGDADALSRALERLLRDRALASALTWRGYSWSKEHLHAEAAADRHLSIYGRLLAAR